MKIVVRPTGWVVLAAAVVVSGCGGNGRKDRIAASGTIEATEVNVAAKSAGTLLELRVSEGATVAPGDTLALLDHATLDLQLLQAVAGVEQAVAQLDLLRNGAREEDIQQADEGLRQAEANLQQVKNDADRIEGLFRASSATRKQMDDIHARLAIAQAQYNSARQVRSKLDHPVRPEELRAGEARLSQAQASADLVRKMVNDCWVTSLIGGTVTNLPAAVGELVPLGGTVATVTDLERMSLMIYVSEKELPRVKLGAPAEVRIDADRSRTYPGKVAYISPQAEFTPKNVQTREDRVKLVFGVRIDLENPDDRLKPGMPADAAVKTEPRSARNDQ